MVGNVIPVSYCDQCRSDYSEYISKDDDGRKIWNEQHKGYWNHYLSKDCPLYLGSVAEKVLSNYFDGIHRMSCQNVGYDFICKNGYKIDVKSSCRHVNHWKFGIRHNHIADLFLCLAFDNRELLNPEHVWLIPGNLICDKACFLIYDTEHSLRQWLSCEKPLERVVESCDAMKNGVI
jgi:hypothetical protein